MLASLSGGEAIATYVGTSLALLGATAAVLRFLIHNATDPIATKVNTHDTQINQSLELGNSTLIKVARIEGFLAGNGTDKLPGVAPTVEIPYDGKIIEKPLEPLG
jgi:hypothetical protein